MKLGSKEGNHVYLYVILIAAIPALLAAVVWGFLLADEKDARTQTDAQVRTARIIACRSANEIRLRSLQYRVNQYATEKELANELSIIAYPGLDLRGIVSKFETDLRNSLLKNIQLERPVDCVHFVDTGERRYLPLPESITSKL